MRESKREARIRSAIQTEMTRAEGGRTDEFQAKRDRALKYYYGLPRGDEIAGRSQVVALELSASVNATLSLMRSMLIDEASVVFEAYGPQDEQLARAESQIVSDVIYKDNTGERILMDAIKDGLLSGQTVVAVDQNEDGRCMLRAVPSENVSYQAMYEGDLQDIRFFSELVPYSRSDLIEMGCKKSQVEDLGARRDTGFNPASSRRNRVTSSTLYDAPERAEDIIECFWCYIKLDLNGDGVSERYRVLYADENVLKVEPHDHIPYAMGSPFTSPHRLTGESLFDRLEQVQDVSTSLWRQLLDNVAIMNNGRLVYDPARVSEEDVLNPTAGGGIRSRDPMAVNQLALQDVTGGILAAIENNRRRRSEVAGSALEMASADAQLVAKSATQASIDKSNSELVTTLIAQNLAQTCIRDLFQLVRYCLRTYSQRPYPALIAGQVVPVNPLEWVPSRRINIRCGKSPGEKSQAAQALMMHMQNQAMAMQGGMSGVLADANTIYRTSLQFLELNGVSDPESLQIDPASPQAQQAMQAAQQSAQAQQQAAQQAVQAQQQMEQAKIAEDARQADLENRFKYDELASEMEIEMAKLSAGGRLELEKQARDHAAAAASSAGSNAANSEIV